MYRAKRIFKPKRSLEERINYFLSIVLVLGVLPVFITTLLGRMETEDLLFNRSDAGSSEVEAKLPGILAKQISIDMPKEAIKAQSVIARTQIMSAEKSGNEQPAAYTIAELQELWGEQFDSYYQIMQKIIAETEGETLQYNNQYIYAAYHQASAGNTRNMSEYYEKSAMPYLVSTACHGDTAANGYLNVFFWTKEDFLTLCKTVFPDETVTGGADVTVSKRDSAGYALQVQVGQTIYEGEAFRKKLNLPSACLELTLIDEDIRIVTMGQGHGFGLSQYAAGQMAEEGSTYREILQYFYKGAVIIE